MLFCSTTNTILYILFINMLFIFTNNQFFYISLVLLF